MTVFAPDYAQARQCYETRQWRAAIEIYQRIVAAAPAQLQAWALMGLCATQAGDLDLAIDALGRAAALEPTAANVHFRLGIALFQRGRAAEAETAFRRTLALDPDNTDARQNLGAVLVDLGRHAEARPEFQVIVAKDPGAELAWAGLANVYRVLGDDAAMVGALEKAVAANPNNPATRHLLRAARGENPAHPEWDYVEGFFDDYAARFDAHLVDRLAYDAPSILTRTIADATPARFARTLDLGCGTGLFARALRQMHAPDVLIGVDLSGRMVQAAKASGYYTAVIKDEAERYLTTCTETFDLIAATDVFIYVGDVDGVFAGASARLVPGGVLAFTVEPIDGDGFFLRTSGRYAHGRGYLRALGARYGFRILAEHAAPLRRDGAGAEDGLYMVLEKTER